MKSRPSTPERPFDVRRHAVERDRHVGAGGLPRGQVERRRRTRQRDATGGVAVEHRCRRVTAGVVIPAREHVEPRVGAEVARTDVDSSPASRPRAPSCSRASRRSRSRRSARDRRGGAAPTIDGAAPCGGPWTSSSPSSGAGTVTTVSTRCRLDELAWKDDARRSHRRRCRRRRGPSSRR